MKEALFAALLALCLAAPALPPATKIDPETYICAELLASNTSGEPPLLKACRWKAMPAQKAAARSWPTSFCHGTYAYLDIRHLPGRADRHEFCPTGTRSGKNLPIATEGPYRADKTTCGEYYADEDNGSGFLIWLDGWQRAKNGRQDSIFENQATLDRSSWPPARTRPTN